MQTDKNGYLLDWQIWDEAQAEQLAKQEEIVLTSSHWHIINYLRSFYSQYHMLPSMRLLIKTLQQQLGSSCPTNSELQLLFPAGLFKQASKIAGLPKPVRCV